MSIDDQKGSVDLEGLTGMLILFVLFASWLTHVSTCFLDESWGFLIAGALMFPVAIVHGFGVWFGVW